ncbi:MAG: terpene cyclase/mutase family protein [Candidatus Wildermuthbacteria bacterium]|nr:terpene cyclase/mutase family protein [Candidatus Wildermuthbacteria bacterium]
MKKKSNIVLGSFLVLLLSFMLVAPTGALSKDSKDDLPQEKQEKGEKIVQEEQGGGDTNSDGGGTGDGAGTEEGEGGNSGGSGSSENDSTGADVSEVIQKAVAYLQVQAESSDRAIALIAAGQTIDVSFLKSFSGDTAIAYAKPILAITAAGKDPRSYPVEDWVVEMKSFADNTQIGDSSLVNDDIWAILALMSAGVPASDSVIQNSKTFILTNQNADGGWAWNAGGDSDTNDTAGAMMALLEIGVSKSDTAIQNGISYLKLAQNDDGGFPYDPKSPFGTGSDGNSDAWIIMAINKLGENVSSWAKSGRSPIDHLLSLQDEDGGFWWMAPPAEFNNKGPTTDAVIALLGKSFPVRSISLSSQVAQGQAETAGGAASEQLSGEVVGEEVTLGQIAQELTQIAKEVERLQRATYALVTARAMVAIQKEAPKVVEEIPDEEMDEEGEKSMLAEDQEELQSSVFSEESSEVPFRAEAASTGFMESLRGNGWLTAGVLVSSVIVGFGLYRFGFIPRAKRRLLRK